MIIITEYFFDDAPKNKSIGWLKDYYYKKINSIIKELYFLIHNRINEISICIGSEIYSNIKNAYYIETPTLAKTFEELDFRNFINIKTNSEIKKSNDLEHIGYMINKKIFYNYILGNKIIIGKEEEIKQYITIQLRKEKIIKLNG